MKDKYGYIIASGTYIEDAKKLAEQFSNSKEALALGLSSRVEGEGRDGQIVFAGGSSGEHSIFLSVSSQERIHAHWNGYLKSAAEKRPHEMKPGARSVAMLDLNISRTSVNGDASVVVLLFAKATNGRQMLFVYSAENIQRATVLGFAEADASDLRDEGCTDVRVLPIETGK